MSLHPDAERLLLMRREVGAKPFETMTPLEARAAYAAGRGVLQPPPAPVGLVEGLSAPGPHGPIPLRRYRPFGSEPGRVLPTLVYLHGGGWVFGDLDSHDGVCRSLSNAAFCQIVSVDYRLAPEHVFPAAVDDALAALRYVHANAAALAADPARLMVGGDSAGGNLAAVLALMARDGTAPPVIHQLLNYPVTDLTMSQDAYRRVTRDMPLTSVTMAWFIDHYLHGADATDWRASPLRAASLSGVAPATIVSAYYDPLCDDAVEYARRLSREGVRVAHLHFSDQVHGFLTMGAVLRTSGTAIAMLGAALAQAVTEGG